MKTTPTTDPISPDAIAQALRFDSLAHAEKLTGLSYKEDKLTSLLGMGIHINHVKTKKALLMAAHDTHFGLAWVDFRAMLPTMGFETLFVESFLDEEGKPEEAICAWDAQRGALLWAETYRLNGDRNPDYPPGINSGKVYFGWRPRQDAGWLEHGSSSPCGDGTIMIDYDIREGLKHNLADAAAKGEFVKPWSSLPFLWLLTYMDTKVKGYDYNAINAARLAKLPVEVRQVMGIAS